MFPESQATLSVYADHAVAVVSISRGARYPKCGEIIEDHKRS
jgi:hypothetical protein